MLIPTKNALPFRARKTMIELLTVFGDSVFTFHLAGSHYFGVATDESDVDLYAQYSPKLLVWLRDQGFRRLGPGGGSIRIEGEKYLAMVANHELDHTNGVFAHATRNVHVQVFYNLDVALRARDILSTCFNVEHARTRGADRSKMWRAALSAAQTILDAASAA
jgi:hypothetical protein